MNSGTGLIAPLVQSFFTDHLVRQRRASPQTVASYRDTFRLLIQHLSRTTGKKPSDLTLDDLQAKAIMQFLDGIERDPSAQTGPRAFFWNFGRGVDCTVISPTDGVSVI